MPGTLRGTGDAFVCVRVQTWACVSTQYHAILQEDGSVIILLLRSRRLGPGEVLHVAKAVLLGGGGGSRFLSPMNLTPQLCSYAWK